MDPESEGFASTEKTTEESALDVPDDDDLDFIDDGRPQAQERDDDSDDQWCAIDKSNILQGRRTRRKVRDEDRYAVKYARRELYLDDFNTSEEESLMKSIEGDSDPCGMREEDSSDTEYDPRLTSGSEADPDDGIPLHKKMKERKRRKSQINPSAQQTNKGGVAQQPGKAHEAEALGNKDAIRKREKDSKRKREKDGHDDEKHKKRKKHKKKDRSDNKDDKKHREKKKRDVQRDKTGRDARPVAKTSATGIPLSVPVAIASTQ